MSKDFFERKEGKAKLELPAHGEYDAKNFDNDLASCGITDVEGFMARHKEMFASLTVDSGQDNPVATVCKKMEETFSHREICFLMSKDLLQAAYNDSMNRLKESK